MDEPTVRRRVRKCHDRSPPVTSNFMSGWIWQSSDDFDRRGNGPSIAGR